MNLFASIELGHRALDYHLERHNVLAGNVANVDTPGFRPLELTRPEDRPVEEPVLPMRTTNTHHLSTLDEVQSTAFAIGQERVVNAGNDENAVSLERELAKVAANDFRYESASTIVSRQLAGLRYAAMDGQGG